MSSNRMFADVPTYRRGYVSPSGVKVLYSKDWAKHHPLEGDGLRPQLYLHLWKKNKGSESRLKNVRLPDTVVYEHNFPRAWYTYDAEAREINKHPGKMLDAQSIYQHFSRPTAGYEIVAQFLTTCPVDDPESLTPNGELISYSEIFTAETLREFLFNKSRKPDGILQKFVPPKGETTMRRNAQLQVSWSPLMAVVYKRTNKYRLDDHRVPVHMRAATFDGDNHLSELSLVADETKGRLDLLCREVVDHVYFTDRKLITRMVLHFRIDDDNRPWLLWCSSLRVSGDSLNPRTVRIPVTLTMRVEMLNNGSSTKDRIKKRQDRQRHLLIMDTELYELSRDNDLGHQCNASHVREAKRLGLSPKKLPKTGNNLKVPLRHPLRPAMTYFADTLLEDALRNLEINSGLPSPTLAQQELDAMAQKHAGASLEDKPEDRVKNELTAMALDAWYQVYSSTLSERPHEMPTQLVELSDPLMVVLKPEEFRNLLDILGLEPTAKASAAPVSGEGGAETGQAGGDPPTNTFRVKLGLLRPGKRLDRPLSNAERDVRNFFDDIFSERGEEIVQRCLSEEKWIW
ncbi:uncharacterized protein TEOVI_000543400 [Trypanosoma equiperdum]|uniref:Uncharacterized protein n=2 Tax=Trypanozoon TaxID=39700 RepID=Q585P4_TRYB2|nr:hypothetical protein, conserved [Trypanosoma brucei brucei TREU927]AAX79725.1 hypothetical protein, conserved [Trypanosoma brucei]AAZ11729.1 hypothetical protein, conserved [Trypanosoma brucei brucei TREU927]SCU73240.1 hypothetical protein, conserved [Trypanosoma equiperdum]